MSRFVLKKNSKVKVWCPTGCGYPLVVTSGENTHTNGLRSIRKGVGDSLIANGSCPKCGFSYEITSIERHVE